MKIRGDKIQDRLKELAEEIGGSFVTGYSGRGMFGKNCIGIICDYPLSCVEAAGAIGITGARTDSMGLGAIVYWPHIQAAAERKSA